VSTTGNGDERRRTPRISSAWLVSYADYDAEQVLRSLGIGKTIDLSDGGLKVWCTETFRVPTDLDVDLALGDQILRVRGRVVHAEEIEPGKYTMGIRFVDPPAESMGRIKAFLARRSGR
jgi:hypothetical protein